DGDALAVVLDAVPGGAEVGDPARREHALDLGERAVGARYVLQRGDREDEAEGAVGERQALRGGADAAVLGAHVGAERGERVVARRVVAPEPLERALARADLEHGALRVRGAEP